MLVLHVSRNRGPRSTSAAFGIRAAIERAIASGGTISFKDSLVDLDMLLELAKWIDDRTFWSACTKLEASLPTHSPPSLAVAATRSRSVETLEPVGQRDARKRQRTSAFLALLDAAAEFGIALIVNYITGFPRSSPLEEEEVLQYVVRELRRRPDSSGSSSTIRSRWNGSLVLPGARARSVSVSLENTHGRVFSTGCECLVRPTSRL